MLLHREAFRVWSPDWSHYLPIAWKRIVSCWWPFSNFVIKDFGFQSVSVRIVSSNKRWVLIRSQWQYVKMRKIWRWFSFEIGTVKTNCMHQLYDRRVVRQHLLIRSLVSCSSKTVFFSITCGRKYLAWSVIATKNPHFVVQSRRAWVINLRIGTICEVQIIIK